MRALHLLPQPLARVVVRAGARAIALYNRAFHPHVRGVGVFVRHADHLLLVRSTYQSWWGLPGGRIDRGETPRVAAARELREETALAVDPGALTDLGDLHLEHNHIRDHVTFFELRCELEPIVRCDGAEIAELRWVREGEIASLKLWPPLAAWRARSGR
ncbi:MAG: NUDIX hydrolase [Deltaproteobacteria bacterium]|nr:NUDIX hydrolase [Deltaproteobacteria bacterium]